MKFSQPQQKTYTLGKNPKPITIFFGPNSERNRQEAKKFSKLALGEEAERDMRLERFDYKTLSKDPALLHDSLRAFGFFAGKRGALIFDIPETGFSLLEKALDSVDEQAIIIAQCDNLKKTGKIRKVFEPHDDVAMIALYDNPLNKSEITELAKSLGLGISDESAQYLWNFATHYDRAGFEQFLNTLALYQGDDVEISLEAIQGLQPGGYASGADEVVDFMVMGKSQSMIISLKRALAQGVSIHQIIGAALRRMMMIVQVLASPTPSQTLNNLRPPLFGPRRQVMENAVKIFQYEKARDAMGILREAEAELRRSKRFYPELAASERVLLRVSSMARTR